MGPVSPPERYVIYIYIRWQEYIYIWMYSQRSMVDYRHQKSFKRAFLLRIYIYIYIMYLGIYNGGCCGGLLRTSGVLKWHWKLERKPYQCLGLLNAQCNGRLFRCVVSLESQWPRLWFDSVAAVGIAASICPSVVYLYISLYIYIYI